MTNQQIANHAKEIAWAVGNSILDSEDELLGNLLLSQLSKIREIVELETFEYLQQLNENGRLQLQTRN